jgi:N-acetylglucosamine-6-sulfatase
MVCAFRDHDIFSKLFPPNGLNIDGRRLDLDKALTMFAHLGSLLLCCLLAATRYAAGHEQQPLSQAKRPNIVFILSDDQDLHMSSWEYMPFLKRHLIQEGLSFRHHYCTNALCCPSRVSLWTGKAAHNTNVTDVNPPYGTFKTF